MVRGIKPNKGGHSQISPCGLRYSGRKDPFKGMTKAQGEKLIAEVEARDAKKRK